MCSVGTFHTNPTLNNRNKRSINACLKENVTFQFSHKFFFYLLSELFLLLFFQITGSSENATVIISGANSDISWESKFQSPPLISLPFQSPLVPHLTLASFHRKSRFPSAGESLLSLTRRVREPVLPGVKFLVDNSRALCHTPRARSKHHSVKFDLDTHLEEAWLGQISVALQSHSQSDSPDHSGRSSTDLVQDQCLKSGWAMVPMTPQPMEL
ncbi:hypothetical protein KIL84_007073 [Mauremys mutica]|uniref:Uncharacterized protein n=1 Tax=Mauremys mutica TaxID=74926 RepID=A0A9D3X2P7_9SAUR|nr:hypothetical protein KIL84_007073 [Mauremys mutica]